MDLFAPFVAHAQTASDVNTQVATLIRSRYDAIHRCYDKALARDPKKQGTVALVLAVEAGGKVSRVSVMRDELDDVEASVCLQRVFADVALAGFDEAAEVGVPLKFDAPPAQYAVRVEDAAVASVAGGQVEARVLIDGVTTGATQAAMTHLAILPHAKVPLHMHPASTEIIYVLSGHGRMRGATDAWHEMGPRTAALVPPGVPHAFEAGDEPVEAVQVYAPPGPEHRFRDPKDTSGAVPVKPDQAHGVAHDVEYADLASARTYKVLDGKGRVHVLVESPAASLGIVSLDPGASVPAHAHTQSAELLYGLAGEAEATIAGTTIDVTPARAIHVPAGAEHSLKAATSAQFCALIVYAPPGPFAGSEPPFGTTTPMDARGR